MRTYVSLIESVSRVCGVIAMALLAAAVVAICHMIIARYGLGRSTIWQTEFSIYAIIAATFLGSPYVLMLKGHVSVDLLPMAVGGAGALVMNLVADLVSLAFCVLLAWSGWEYLHEAWTAGWRSSSVWAPPLWMALLPLPLGIGLLCLQYIAEIIKRLGGVR